MLDVEKDDNGVWNIVCSESGRYEFDITHCPWCGKKLEK